jgi:alkanesulfonate monooxygenase SsuD/methylene tetrahydromethanopterin reductase-like flavin-dependent oxidoreductase (luciferase family)
MQIGYKLATEAFGPKELIRQAVLAEQAGFDFVEMSDHYHPWLEAQGHSAFTWGLLSAIAMKTERTRLTGASPSAGTRCFIAASSPGAA